MAHLFRNIIPSIALSAVQNLSLIASCPLWEFTRNVDFLQKLHMIAKYPLDFPMIPTMVITPFELEFPVFHSDDWIPILDYHEESLAYHVWQCCPPIQNASPSVLATEESKIALLTACGCHDLLQEPTMGWQQSHPLLKKLFEVWAASKPVGLKPYFSQFPFLFSCVLSRLIPPFDITLATSQDAVMTGSQFLFYWHKAIMALDRKIGSQARVELMETAFQEAPRQGGSTYTFKGDVMLTLIHLTIIDYFGFLQPEFIPVCQEFCCFARSPRFEFGYCAKEYMKDVYTGKIRESFLDPIIHFFILERLSLPTLFPDIFPRHLLPVDWSLYFTLAPSLPTSHVLPIPFLKRKLTNHSTISWNRYQKAVSYPDLISSLCFKDGTLVDTSDF